MPTKTPSLPWTDYIPHEPTPRQAVFLSVPHREAMYGGAAGGGKALWVGTPIPTPRGWSCMGDLRVGDRVFDEAGKPCRVLATSGIMHDRPCYEVEFSDGAVIVADADHLWVTMTVGDREKVTRRTDVYRERRRARRERRGVGARPDLARINSERDYEYMEPPEGQPRTTREIAATLTVRDGRRNHSVAVAGALECNSTILPIPPYVLGAWLGDGTSASGGFTSADREVIDEIRGEGYRVEKHNYSDYSYGIHGIVGQLRDCGVLGYKHIPVCYLRADFDQRLALLQGLMDTDGACDQGGQCEFYTTSRALAEDVQDLVNGLGIKATISDGRAVLDGKDCGLKYRIKFLSRHPVFRLPRKLARQKRNGFRGTHRNRYIVDARPVKSVPVCCIQVDAPSKQFLCGRNMIPTHNSDALLMAALQYVDQPGYRAIIFRRTYADLSLPGALMDRAQEWLGGTDARWRAQEKSWEFPSGATVSFGYLQSSTDRFRYQGAEFQFIAFDELTQFPEQDYRYLFSRLRRTEGEAQKKVPLRMRAGSNPGGVGHEWVKRRFITSDDPSRIFIPARLEDNPYLDQHEYEQNLNKLDPVTRSQLRDGDWDARLAGGLFRREFFTLIEAHEVPRDVEWCRFWDFAATEETATTSDDQAYTASVLMGADTEGYIYVRDARRARVGPAGVEAMVKETAQEDRRNFGFVTIRQEQEPGSAGKFVVRDFAKKMHGFDYQGVPATGSKVERARPFSADAANGLVYVVNGSWNEQFFDELEAFPQDGIPCDQVDAASGAHSVVSNAIISDVTRDTPRETPPVFDEQRQRKRSAEEQEHYERTGQELTSRYDVPKSASYGPRF